MRSLRNVPALNAGSMADIGFLLLIFFLVTTTIPNDKGIARKLPEKCPNNDCNISINERNVLRLSINEAGELLVKNDIIALSDLKEIIKVFIDNNGDGSCNYCSGSRIGDSSDNPREAVISVSSHRYAPYATYITVQDIITEAYYDLRKNYVASIFKKMENEISEAELKEVRESYPLNISEADLK